MTMPTDPCNFCGEPTTTKIQGNVPICDDCLKAYRTGYTAALYVAKQQASKAQTADDIRKELDKLADLAAAGV